MGHNERLICTSLELIQPPPPKREASPMRPSMDLPYMPYAAVTDGWVAIHGYCRKKMKEVWLYKRKRNCRTVGAKMTQSEAAGKGTGATGPVNFVFGKPSHWKLNLGQCKVGVGCAKLGYDGTTVENVLSMVYQSIRQEFNYSKLLHHGANDRPLI